MTASSFFSKLDADWNAHPNAPEPKVFGEGGTVRLQFLLNSYAYRAAHNEKAELTFRDCKAWRLCGPNDEGWYLGQCRYAKAAPEWGQFYEVIGDDEVRDLADDWMPATQNGYGSRHFLFYLRDETFECLAERWSFNRGL